MITCERCHTENLEGAQYCDECGAVLSPAGTGPRRPATVGDDSPDAALSAAPPEPSGAHTGRHAPAFSPAHTSAGSGRAAAARGAQGEAGDGANSPHAKLVIYRGRSVGKEFLLNDDESHIGRWDADGGIFPDVDLDADDPEAKVSRRHARITRRGEQYYIEDLGSTNGTFVNRGRRLLPGDRQLLRDGDEVIVGKTFLRFQVLKA